jgi:transcriptional regulator with XRE-family HTH domain
MTAFEKKGIPMVKRESTPEAREIDNFRDNVYDLTYGAQNTFADAIGSSRPWFNAMLKGRGEPLLSKAVRLAKVLGVTVDWLLQDHGKGKERPRYPTRKYNEPKIDQTEHNAKYRVIPEDKTEVSSSPVSRKKAAKRKVDGKKAAPKKSRRRKTA